MSDVTMSSENVQTTDGASGGPSLTSAAPVEMEYRSLWLDSWRAFRRHRIALACLVMLVLIGVISVFGPMVSSWDAEQINFAAKSQPPSLSHPFGTDELGRDQLVRTMEGGRISLMVALVAVTVAITIGVLIGTVAGYAGDAIDNILMRLVDVFYSMPGLLVAILLLALVGQGFWTIVVAIGIFRWMGTARLVRASFLSLKRMEYVEAARTVGVPSHRIAFRHVLPNALSPVIVAATLGIAGAILTESALSFLGLGFQPPQATWGRMLAEAQSVVINQGHWWRGLFPGLMIFITVLSVNFVGDGLRDAVDPRRHDR
jgi:peptide/nickel transport system permease protein